MSPSIDGHALGGDLTESGEGAENLTREGWLDGAFLTRVGAEIRNRRKARGLTVQQLAKSAGISRRLLTQIEHGQANPSLVAVTRLARQLGTDFTTLFATGESTDAIRLLPETEHVLVWSSDHGSTAHLLASTNHVRSADLWRWHLAPGDSYQGHADPAGSQELFYVLHGTLTLQAGEEVAAVSTGSSAQLRSDRAYAYRNDRDQPVIFIRTVALST